MQYKVLIIDDEYLIRVSLREGLRDLGYQTEVAESIIQGLELVEQFRPDVVMLDNHLGDDVGMDYIETIKKFDEDIQIILITAYGSVSQAVQAMRKGACDYVLKPFDIEAIDIAIHRAMDQLKSRRNIALLSGDLPVLVGESAHIRQVRKEIELLAEKDNVDVLVRGETGTGKEVVVKLIHHSSARSSFPLVKINCSAIPENLLESELFGHEKGAFTGAVSTKKGLIEIANGGTVFLDEIGEMPLTMQAKLLTFLEDRKFKRVGGISDIKVNVRVVAATNRPLEQAIQEQRFREDLFYRLNVVQILLSPLRERQGDIVPLAEFYLAHFNRKLRKNVSGISPECIRQLSHYHWKGNVRELKNVLERAVLFCEGDVLEHLGQPFPTEQQMEPPPASPYDFHLTPEDPIKPINLQRELEQLEVAYIKKAIDQCGGNYSKAAELLGYTRFSLRRRLEKE